jgi:hypothetical protein
VVRAERVRGFQAQCGADPRPARVLCAHLRRASGALADALARSLPLLLGSVWTVEGDRRQAYRWGFHEYMTHVHVQPSWMLRRPQLRRALSAWAGARVQLESGARPASLALALIVRKLQEDMWQCVELHSAGCVR